MCHYIAEVLPENGEGGRTGHFIYSDLMRRVSANTYPIRISLIYVTFRQTNLDSISGRNATQKILGESVIANIKLALI